jgi:hypothetical protein
MSESAIGFLGWNSRIVKRWGGMPGCRLNVTPKSRPSRAACRGSMSATACAASKLSR